MPPSSMKGRITASADGWTADRLGVVERNVLRIAIHELETRATPVEVAIDEAVTPPSATPRRTRRL